MEQNKISFVTANFVAKAIGYSLNPDWLKGDWGKGDESTQKLFQGETFEEEFRKLLQVISDAGFKTIELWSAHLDYRSPQKQIQKAKQILDEYEMSVCACAGGFGSSEEEIEKSFQMANTIGAKILAGGIGENLLSKTYQLCQKYGIRFAVENHPRVKTPEKIQRIIENKEKWFGATVDTGWFATFNINPAEAIRKLGKSVFHIHLKDIKEAGKHETCTLGNGIADIPAVIRSLREIDYNGYLSIEHESGDYDPMEEVKESFRRVQDWLKKSGGK